MSVAEQSRRQKQEAGAKMSACPSVRSCKRRHSGDSDSRNLPDGNKYSWIESTGFAGDEGGL